MYGYWEKKNGVIWPYYPTSLLTPLRVCGYPTW